jgi:hypothetical protein
MKTSIDGCIFTNSQTENIGSKEDQYYTINGENDYFDENNNPRLSKDGDKTLAKKTFANESKPRFLIKLDTDGRFFDPTNTLSKDFASKSNFLNQTCRQSRFKSVSYDVFDMYLNFLKTKNLSWLHNSNRGAE